MYKFLRAREKDYDLLKEIANSESRPLIDQFHVILKHYKLYQSISPKLEVINY